MLKELSNIFNKLDEFKRSTPIKVYYSIISNNFEINENSEVIFKEDKPILNLQEKELYELISEAEEEETKFTDDFIKKYLIFYHHFQLYEYNFRENYSIVQFYPEEFNKLCDSDEKFEKSNSDIPAAGFRRSDCFRSDFCEGERSGYFG